jgi:NADPH:quinone reductase
MMKAIRVHEFGGPEVMQLESVPDPQSGPGQVVVGLRAVGVNPVDTYIRAGTYAGRPSFPYTPGMDGAGVVLSVGEGVKRVRVGDRVYVAGTLTGAYAEQALCKEGQVHPLPERVAFSQGAAVNVPYATAYRALYNRGKARPGEVVLVHGASGGVGTASVQIARAAGLTVIGTAGSDRGRKLVIDEGAHHVFDHHNSDYLNQIMALTEGRGVDLILEMLANVNLAKDLGVLAKEGRVVVIGNRGTIEIDPRATMARDSSILGMALMNATESELASIHSALVAGLENGTLRPIIGRELPLGEAPLAHKAVLEAGAYGKVALIP